MKSTAPPKPAKKSSRKLVKRIVTGLTVVMILVGVIIAAIPKPLIVEVAEVSRGELVVTINEDGTSRVHDRYVVSAPLAGNLARIALHNGDTVKQGQVLARILPVSAPLLDTRTRNEAEARVSAALAGLRQSTAQIERAKAAFDFATEEARRTEQLVKSGALTSRELTRAQLDERSSQAELTSAEFSAKVAQHQLTMARAALGRLDQGGGDGTDQFEITSPGAGRILKVIQQSEGVVQAGAPLLEIGDPKALEVAVDVLTSDAVNIRPGADVTLDHWGGPPLKATVRLVEPSAFTRLSALGVQEQRVNAILEINSPYQEWELLGDGYRVEAKIEVFRTKDALRIPWSALFREGKDWAVFVKSGETVHLKRVEVGQRNEVHAQILSGLEAGHVVVVHPSDKLTPGSKIALER